MHDTNVMNRKLRSWDYKLLPLGKTCMMRQYRHCVCVCKCKWMDEFEAMESRNNEKKK